MVHLDVAEVLIVLFLAIGQFRRTEHDFGRIGAKLEAVTVEVIAFSGDEAQLDRLRRAFYQAQLEGFAHGQEVGAVVDRAQGRAWTIFQQAGGAGRQGEH
ncbi:hypothetical protein D3C85_1189320 [compost metagenome]